MPIPATFSDPEGLQATGKPPLEGSRAHGTLLLFKEPLRRFASRAKLDDFESLSTELDPNVEAIGRSGSLSVCDTTRSGLPVRIPAVQVDFGGIRPPSSPAVSAAQPARRLLLRPVHPEIPLLPSWEAPEPSRYGGETRVPGGRPALGPPFPVPVRFLRVASSPQAAPRSFLQSSGDPSLPPSILPSVMNTRWRWHNAKRTDFFSLFLPIL